jgi:site-specific DNA-methyltransferase (adenine-specific)
MIHHGDCLEVLRTLDDNSVDSVVTDPPYGLSFMGKKWDYDVPSVEVWAECLRVLKPGGHLLAFAGTRTQHRMAVRIEDAGFEIRDMIAWVYGSGFPKSLNVSIAIGDEDAARQWQGWGTALKPALEPITVARKPLIGTVANNVTTWGTGGINVDGGRVGRDADDVSGWAQSGSNASENRAMSGANYKREAKPDDAGRFPANLIHDGSDEVVGLFPSDRPGGNFPEGGKKSADTDNAFGAFNGSGQPARAMGDSGSAARFFYVAKASAEDRDDGCVGIAPKSAGQVTGGRAEGSAGLSSPRSGAGRRREETRNSHPTVKPTDLMRYLCRLVTPPGGLVLDPFVGSGSTGRGAVLEGFRFVGIEREAEYVAIARARIDAAIGRRRSDTAQGSLF